LLGLWEDVADVGTRRVGEAVGCLRVHTPVTPRTQWWAGYRTCQNGMSPLALRVALGSLSVQTPSRGEGGHV